MVGGGGKHCPLAAVPNPHQWETGVEEVLTVVVVGLLVVLALVGLLVLLTVDLLVGLALVDLGVVVAVVELDLCEVVEVEEVVLVGGLHLPSNAVPKPHQ